MSLSGNYAKINLKNNPHLKYFEYDMKAARFLYRLHDNDSSKNASEITMGIIMTHPMELYIGDKIQFHSSDLLQKIFKKHWEPFVWKMHRHTYTTGFMPYKIVYEESISDYIPSCVNLYYGSMFSIYNILTTKINYYWKWDDDFNGKGIKGKTQIKADVKQDEVIYDPDVLFFMPYEPIVEPDRTFDIISGNSKNSTFLKSQFTSPWADILHKYKNHKLLDYSQIQIEMDKINKTMVFETVIPFRSEEFNNLVGLYEDEQDKQENKTSSFNDFFGVKNKQRDNINDINISETISQQLFDNKNPVYRSIDELGDGLDCDVQKNDGDGVQGLQERTGIDGQPIVLDNVQYSREQISASLDRAKKDTRGLFHDPYFVNGKDGAKIMIVSPIHRMKTLPSSSGRSDWQQLMVEFTSAIYKMYGVPPALAAGVNKLNTATEVQTSESILGRSADIITGRYEPFLQEIYLKIYGRRYTDFKENRKQQLKKIISFQLKESFETEENEKQTKSKNSKGIQKEDKKNGTKSNGKIVQIVKENKDDLKENILSDIVIGHIEKELGLTLQFNPVPVQSIDSIIQITQAGLISLEEGSLLTKQKMNMVSGDVNNWGGKNPSGGNTLSNKNDKAKTGTNGNANKPTDSTSKLNDTIKKLDKSINSLGNNDGSKSKDSENKKKRKLDSNENKNKNKKKKTE